MRKIFAIAVGLALSLSMLGAEASAKVKACWIYVGPVGDFGYSYQHDQGRLQTFPKAPTPSAPSSAWRVRAATSSLPPPSASWMPPSRLPRNFPT
jgi:hypothetical protein